MSIALLVVMSVVAIAAPKNVVLIVTDDQGQDAGCYGNPVIKTPNLDALAADGTRFKNAYCTTASCSPSRSVILTGLFNHANGQYGLEHAVPSLSQLRQCEEPARDARARPAIARRGSASFMSGRRACITSTRRWPGNPRNPVEMAEQCRELIEAKSDQPFFLYFCTGDPHRGGAWRTGCRISRIASATSRRANRTRASSRCTTSPADVIVPPFLPDTPTCRAELAQYYESISRADAGLGRLIEILKEGRQVRRHAHHLHLRQRHSVSRREDDACTSPVCDLPCIVRNPEAKKRGVVSERVGELGRYRADDSRIRRRRSRRPARSCTADRSCQFSSKEKPGGWDEVYASHTFHEVTMYYPMRVVRSGQYKLIWNIAHPLPFPFASDLWGSATWQDSLKRGERFHVRQANDQEPDAAAAVRAVRFGSGSGRNSQPGRAIRSTHETLAELQNKAARVSEADGRSVDSEVGSGVDGMRVQSPYPRGCLLCHVQALSTISRIE